MRRGRLTIPVAVGGAIALLIVGAITAYALGAFQPGQDRAALARQTVHTYWTDIEQAKIRQAYDLLTPGNQQARPLSSYSQDMFGFLESTGGVTVRVGNPSIGGDTAVVPVALYSPKATQPLRAFQHLYWNNNTWQISDPNGGLSHTR